MQVRVADCHISITQFYFTSSPSSLVTKSSILYTVNLRKMMCRSQRFAEIFYLSTKNRVFTTFCWWWKRLIDCEEIGKTCITTFHCKLPDPFLRHPQHVVGNPGVTAFIGSTLTHVYRELYKLTYNYPNYSPVMQYYTQGFYFLKRQRITMCTDFRKQQLNTYLGINR